MNKKAPRGDAPLDLLYAELVRATGSDKESSILDICISGKQREIASVPLRYRLIALGFVKKLSPEEVNRRLLENGCPRLYARSYWEASVIYALRKGLSYAQWKDLLVQCDKQREKIVSNNKAFSRKSISLADIRTYVNDNSLQTADFNSTMQMTREIEKELAALASGNEGGQDSGQAGFLEYLRSNIESFSTVREKARYYFCKYLLYDLDRRIKICMDHAKQEAEKSLKEKKTSRSSEVKVYIPKDSALKVFYDLTPLRRKKYTLDVIREGLEKAALSLHDIYELYSRFYFDIPFLNWIHVLDISGADPAALPSDDSKDLANAVRREAALMKKRKKKEGEKEDYPEDSSDAAQLRWLQDKLLRSELEDPRSPLADRRGELFLRKVLRGTLDLDRTTLLSFLLYFGAVARSAIPAAHIINRERLNVILEESGFSVLDPDLPFDRFVCDFLESRDPEVFLIGQAEEMALSGKNFYLHQTWRLAQSEERQWSSLT